VREEGPGAVASAPVEEPTDAAALHLILLPDTESENMRDHGYGTTFVSWARLRRAIHATRGSQP
jgi:hypothetical protein